jgi:hypothetical protein
MINKMKSKKTFKYTLFKIKSYTFDEQVRLKHMCHMGHGIGPQNIEGLKIKFIWYVVLVNNGVET